jgi:hypothetical protein
MLNTPVPCTCDYAWSFPASRQCYKKLSKLFWPRKKKKKKQKKNHGIFKLLYFSESLIVVLASRISFQLFVNFFSREKRFEKGQFGEKDEVKKHFEWYKKLN